MIEFEKVIESERPNTLCGLCHEVQECMEHHIMANGVDSDAPVVCLKESPAEYLKLKKTYENLNKTGATSE